MVMEEQLIEHVRRHEVLYNTALKDYKDQCVRQEAWEEIARQLNITTADAKKKWDKLRKCYNNARSRRRMHKSGQATKYIAQWKFEQQMGFLSPYLEDRRTLGNLQNIANVSKERTDMEGESTVMGASEDFLLENVQCAGDGPSNQTTSERTNEIHYEKNKTPEENIRLLSDIKASKQNQREKKTSLDKVLSVMEENAALRKRKYEEKCETRKRHSCLEDMDDMSMYFMSLARITKKLPKAEQVRVKREVGNIVLDAELKNCEHEAWNYSVRASTPIPSAANIVCEPQCSPQSDILPSPTDQALHVIEEYCTFPTTSDLIRVHESDIIDQDNI